MNLFFIPFLLLGMTPLSNGPDDSREAAALKPVHFRIEAAVDESSFADAAAVRLEASKEGGLEYDRAVLDLDGDGKPDRTLHLDKGPNPVAKGRFNAILDLRLGGLDWKLDLTGSLSDPVNGRVYMDWSLSKDDLFLFFINGSDNLYATAGEAAKGKAIRLGPPFHFALSTSTRGPDAMVNVGLKDLNDATLRMATRRSQGRSGGEGSSIHLAFLTDGEEGASIEAEYG